MSDGIGKLDVIVIGAGLSGLASALLAVEAGKTVRVLEAHAKPGGRIRSVFDERTNAFVADLGPSWVWPAFQPVIGRWLEKLGLETFAQFDAGEAVLDYGPDQPAQTALIPGQEGNERVVGGSQALVDAMVSKLPQGMVLTSTPATAVQVMDAGVLVGAGNAVLTAGQVIVALPPRLALSSIDWKSALPGGLQDALGSMPTWMAPHAKVAVLYDRPFWREAGLSGRIASRAGPLVEAHDHCGSEGEPAALWGFIGLSPEARAALGDELEVHIRAQLKRCFGEAIPEPLAVHVEDWAKNRFVASPGDLSGPITHPDVGPEALREVYFDGRLCFAGAETAHQSPGLIEGAFDAAERVVLSLQIATK
ncbi:MAG: FAD-dependent oxidoreductase [Alphaproteobacteria bacterium]|nr:FAD-dependent oxidoreductase [Alphaproteobacteria bacterium]